MSYLPLNRKFFKHEFWDENRVFSRAEAWIDLIATANFKDETPIKVNGKIISIKTGQLVASLSYLGKRWQWSKDKVLRFLRLLETDGMITRELIQKETVITMLNYEVYNKLAATITSQPTATITDQQPQHEDTSNNNILKEITDQRPQRKPTNDRNDNKSQYNTLNTLNTLNIFDREKKFIELVEFYNNEFPKHIIENFINYYTEKTLDGKKLKYQTFKTFEIKKRLNTFLRNDNGKPTNNQTKQEYVKPVKYDR